MKKINSIILFAVLTSSSLPLVQATIREGSENRGQKTESKTTELPLEDKIGLGGEITTNCNNQRKDLDCYLMMNPEKISVAENILGISGKISLPSKTPVGTINAIHSSLKSELSSEACLGEDSSTVIPIVSIVESTKNQSEAIAFAKLKASEAMEQTIAAKGASEAALDKASCSDSNAYDSVTESNAWESVLAQTEQAAENWQKVSERLSEGKEERAALWRKAAEQSEDAAEEWKRIAQASASGTDFVDEAAACTADQLSKIAICIAKSKEAIDAGNQSLADLLSKTAAQHQKSVECYQKSVEEEESENTTNILLWCDAHHCSALELDKAVLAFEKAIIETVEGNQDLVALWLRTSKQYEEASEYQHQAANAAISENPTDYDHFDRAFRSAGDSANQLEKASESLKKATQARKANQEEVAALWFKTVEQYKETAEYKRQVVDASLNGNDTDCDRFNKAAKSALTCADLLEKASESVEKATKAMERNQGEIAGLWIKTAAQYEEAVEYQYQAVNAAISENTTDYKYFNQVSTSVGHSPNRLAKASEALEKATQAREKSHEELADLWIKIAKQYEESAEYERQVAIANLNEKDTDCDRFDKECTSAWYSSNRLGKIFGALEKATQANKANQGEFAELWIKNAKQYEVAAKYEQSALAFAEEKDNEGSNLFNEGDSL